jgi:hypothetical protein
MPYGVSLVFVLRVARSYFYAYSSRAWRARVRAAEPKKHKHKQTPRTKFNKETEKAAQYIIIYLSKPQRKQQASSKPQHKPPTTAKGEKKQRYLYMLYAYARCMCDDV